MIVLGLYKSDTIQLEAGARTIRWNDNENVSLLNIALKREALGVFFKVYGTTSKTFGC